MSKVKLNMLKDLCKKTIRLETDTETLIRSTNDMNMSFEQTSIKFLLMNRCGNEDATGRVSAL